VVALGTFDGVHRGHVAILNEATRQARACAADSVALTFDRLPLELLRPSEAPPLLTPPDERMCLLRHHVDRVVSLRFDWPLAKLSPAEFVEQVLIQGLGSRAIVVGFNYTFGRQGNGNADTLRELVRPLRVPVTVIPPVSCSDLGQISSTSIRHLVAAGDVQSAADMLGRPFALIGRVAKGQARGRKLGFPTANIVCHPRQILPGEGVYVSEATYADGRRIGDAVTAISRQPTFSGSSITVECHILGFAGDLYGERLAIRLHKRLRKPMRFASVKDLQDQIARDISAAREFLRVLHLHDNRDMIDSTGGTLS
jgi:riboflavin kinase/FMN adenylyltransferase